MSIDCSHTKLSTKAAVEMFLYGLPVGCSVNELHTRNAIYEDTRFILEMVGYTTATVDVLYVDVRVSITCVLVLFQRTKGLTNKTPACVSGNIVVTLAFYSNMIRFVTIML